MENYLLKREKVRENNECRCTRYFGGTFPFSANISPYKPQADEINSSRISNQGLVACSVSNPRFSGLTYAHRALDGLTHSHTTTPFDARGKQAF